MEISDKIIEEIASELEIDMRCFLNLKTVEIVTYPKELELSDFEDDWKEITDKVKKHKKEYVEIEDIDSRESYRIMEGFIAQISHDRTRIKFEEAISGKQPSAGSMH